MDAKQQQAMREGRQRAAQKRRREAIQRVKRYQAWLKAGSRMTAIPEIPSDDDYEAFRSSRRSR